MIGLPPYVGMMLSLGVVWIVTEWIYGHRKVSMREDAKHRVSQIVKNIHPLLPRHTLR